MEFFYSLISLLFVTLMLNSILFLKKQHTSYLHAVSVSWRHHQPLLCLTVLKAKSIHCGEGEGLRMARWDVSCCIGRRKSDCQVRGFPVLEGGGIWEHLLCMRKRENATKVLRSSSELLLPGGCFLVGCSSSICFPCTAQCRVTLVDLRCVP